MGQGDIVIVRAVAVQPQPLRRHARKHFENSIFGSHLVAIDGEIIELDLARRIAISIALFKLWCRQAGMLYVGLLVVWFDLGTVSPSVAVDGSNALLAAIVADMAGWPSIRQLVISLAMVAAICNVWGAY